MNKSVKVIVNGKPYEVEIEELGGNRSKVLVNGTAYDVELESSGQSQPAAAATAAPRAAVEAPRPTVKAAPAGGNALTAPMPGVILDIAVKPGDKVAYGGMLCALEAMKMKNAIRANREVVVASVEVQDGQKVAYGDVLFRFA